METYNTKFSYDEKVSYALKDKNSNEYLKDFYREDGCWIPYNTHTLLYAWKEKSKEEIFKRELITDEVMKNYIIVKVTEKTVINYNVSEA
jgi:hypothetical protein